MATHPENEKPVEQERGHHAPYDRHYRTDALTLAVEMTAAWIGNPNTRAGPDAALTSLTTIHASTVSLAGGAPATDDRAPESI